MFVCSYMKLFAGRADTSAIVQTWQIPTVGAAQPFFFTGHGLHTFSGRIPADI